jgi:hypothetical protein
MKPMPGSVRIWLALILLVCFVSLSLVFPAGGWVGGACIDDLIEPSREPIPMNAWTDYGFPFPVLRRSIVDCNPTPQWKILWFGLAINAAIYFLVGFGLDRLIARRWNMVRESERS